MADARPTFPLPQRYTQRKTDAVQPPDDRTYSAEVTVFQRNLPHHRSTRIVSLHTLDYDTTLFPFCQEEFLFFSQSFLCIFVHSDGVKKLYNMNGAALPAPFLYQPAISFSRTTTGAKLSAIANLCSAIAAILSAPLYSSNI